jgi:hypothetical protein
MTGKKNNKKLQVSREIVRTIREASIYLIVVFTVLSFVLYLFIPKLAFTEVTLCKFESSFCFAKNLKEIKKLSKVIS